MASLVSKIQICRNKCQFFLFGFSIEWWSCFPSFHTSAGWSLITPTLLQVEECTLAQPQRTIMQMLKILKMITIFKKRVSFCTICHNQTDRRHTNKQNDIFDMSDLKWKIVLFEPQLEHLDFWPLETFTWNWIVGLIINCHCRYNFHYIRAM